jgi:endonuclease YncB( thermonuclease family)
MKRKDAFILALLCTILLAANFYFFHNLENRRTVKITRVIDGDTIVFGDETARLLNINTPEKNEKGYEEAKNFLLQYENESVEIEFTSLDKYDRLLVRVFAPEYLNLQLVKQGLAKKFLVEEAELKLFDDAETQAVEQERGLWSKSNFSECISSAVFPYEEFVEITNRCSKINLANFYLEDESRKKYKFPSIEIGTVILHSLNGTNNETDLFWGNSGNVWNNDRDTAYLFDAEGNLVCHSSYGY